MRASHAVLIAALLSGSAAPAGAQDVPSVLTLADAQRLARQSSPAWRRSANDGDVTGVAVRQAWAGFLPSVSTSMGFSGNSSTTTRGTGDFGQTVETDPITVRNSSASQGVNLNLTLFDGGAMFRRFAAARAQDEATDASIGVAGATLDAQVTRDYFEARRTDMLVDVERRNLEAARRRYEDNQERFRIAAIDQVALLDAQRAVITAEQSVRAAEANTQKARLMLSTTIGLDASIRFEVADEMPEVFDPSTLDASALVARALQESPTVRQRTAAVEAARHNAAVARGGWWPTISGGLGYGRNTSERGFGAFGDLNPEGSRGYSFSINVSFPIFNRFQTSMQVAQATAAREDAEQDARQARLDTERLIRAGLIDLQRAYENFTAQQQIANLSQQQVELAEEQFRLGALDFLRFQNLVDANAQAQRQAVEARFEFVRNQVALEERLGGPVRR
ncbi:MAG: TolC family protein [Gemmatimonadetes bacterium]|nr:TolC family protein [Gemmatimonadota bacterium]